MDNINDKILEKSKSLWGITDELVFIRRVANYIYYAPQSKVYFRLTESWHRNIEQVKSELDWMFYLQTRGIDFAHPIKSKSDEYCETVESGDEKYIVSVFKEARGKRIIEKEEFNDELLSNWGEIIGKMHSYTKDYKPSEVQRRSEWNAEEYHENILKLIRPEHGKIYEEFNRLDKLFSTFPKDNHSYGLIHADLHTGNFHVDENNQIMSFDFDDCVYGWFIYDIVVFLWALESFNLNWERVQESILEGYNKHNRIDEFWFNHMPDFYNYRVILIHYYCMKALSDRKLNETSREWMSSRVKKSRDYFNLEKPYPF
ncbi:MAG: phosphotransferase [Halobacteriovoraceae bacterium]|jgi:amicoumacin kinase|nr:phosphotransferase [Halobacteriovoraceae bacterium]